MVFPTDKIRIIHSMIVMKNVTELVIVSQREMVGEEILLIILTDYKLM